MGKRETRPGSFSASADSGLKFPKVSRHGQGKTASGPNSGRRTSSLSSRDERRKLDAQRQADAYVKVNLRDRGRCRVCGTVTGWLHHHHIVPRSRADFDARHHTSNIASVCVACHTYIHTSGMLKVSGDADLTDQDGVCCGLEIHRKEADEWRLVEKR